MSRPCYPSLDKPFEVFLGLGPGELLLIAIVGLVLMTVWNAPAGLLGGAAFGAVVSHLREGKPRGYAFTLAYKCGLFGILPQGLLPPGLLPARGLWGSRLQRFSGVPGPADDDGPEARHFWSGNLERE